MSNDDPDLEKQMNQEIAFRCEQFTCIDAHCQKVNADSSWCSLPPTQKQMHVSSFTTIKATYNINNDGTYDVCFVRNDEPFNTFMTFRRYEYWSNTWTITRLNQSRLRLHFPNEMIYEFDITTTLLRLLTGIEDLEVYSRVTDTALANNESSQPFKKACKMAFNILLGKHGHSKQETKYLPLDGLLALVTKASHTVVTMLASESLKNGNLPQVDILFHKQAIDMSYWVEMLIFHDKEIARAGTYVWHMYLKQYAQWGRNLPSHYTEPTELMTIILKEFLKPRTEALKKAEAELAEERKAAELAEEEETTKEREVAEVSPLQTDISQTREPSDSSTEAVNSEAQPPTNENNENKKEGEKGKLKKNEPYMSAALAVCTTIRLPFENATQNECYQHHHHLLYAFTDYIFWKSKEYVRYVSENERFDGLMQRKHKPSISRMKKKLPERFFQVGRKLWENVEDACICLCEELERVALDPDESDNFVFNVKFIVNKCHPYQTLKRLCPTNKKDNK